MSPYGRPCERTSSLPARRTGNSHRFPLVSHPELDDRFFSIDDFNRQTEEAEATFASRGKLGGDEDEEESEEDEESGDLANLLGRDVEGDEAMEENAGGEHREPSGHSKTTDPSIR